MRHFEANRSDYSISKSLGFQFHDGFNYPNDFRNAYALLHKISTQQIVPSYVHTAEILSKLCNLQYDGTSDPKLFTLQFHEYFMLGSLLGIEWPTFSDNGKALFMLSKLSGPLLASLRWSLHSFNKIKPLSLKDVEEELIQWWINLNDHPKPLHISKFSNNYSNSNHSLKRYYDNTDVSGDTYFSSSSHRKFFTDLSDNSSSIDESLDISEISSMDDESSALSTHLMDSITSELANNVLSPIKWAKNPLNLLSLFNPHEKSYLIDDMIDKGIATEENVRQYVPPSIPKLSKSQKIRYKRKLRHIIIYWKPKTQSSSSNPSDLTSSNICNTCQNISDENLTNAISSASDDSVNFLSAEKQFLLLQFSKSNPVVYSKSHPKLTLKQKKKIKKEKEKLLNNNSE
jgi:hypothetical protein